MRLGQFLGLCLLFGSWCEASAGRPIIVSSSADTTTVTLYRDPARDADEAIKFDDGELLGGYAMVTETRTVDLPPGEVMVRFEGVASGIVPQSAILLNGQVGEKNFDRRLLSQRGLLDAFTGQRVLIRYVDDGSGKPREDEGTIVSQPDRLVLKTKRGYEAINCDGRLGTILFPSLPVDLTAKPTLSMTIRPDNRGGRMKLTLAYLADNFDWQADYVGTFSADARTLKLFGWMTVASKDRTPFVQTELSAVAGEVWRTGYGWEERDAAEEERENDPYSDDNIGLRVVCWPKETSAQSPTFSPEPIPSLVIQFPNVRRYCDFDVEDCDNSDAPIIVTGSRIAQRTDVGDLKLYTVPFLTDLQPQSMKQIRFMNEISIRGEALYEIEHYSFGTEDARLVFRFKNIATNGSGLPLPAGFVRLFQLGPHGRNLVAHSYIKDKTAGEDVEITMDESQSKFLIGKEEVVSSGENWEERIVQFENRNRHATWIEVTFRNSSKFAYSRFSRRVIRRDGAFIWRIQIAALGKAKIRFRTKMSS